MYVFFLVVRYWGIVKGGGGGGIVGCGIIIP